MLILVSTASCISLALGCKLNLQTSFWNGIYVSTKWVLLCIHIAFAGDKRSEANCSIANQIKNKQQNKITKMKSSQVDRESFAFHNNFVVAFLSIWRFEMWNIHTKQTTKFNVRSQLRYAWINCEILPRIQVYIHTDRDSNLQRFLGVWAKITINQFIILTVHGSNKKNV